MKNWKIIILSLSIISINATFGSIKLLDKIVARVNNNVILESDIKEIIDRKRDDLNLSNQNIINKKKLYHHVLKQEILEKIMLEISKNMGISVTDTQLDQVINYIIQNNHMTEDQFYQNLRFIFGEDQHSYRKEIRKKILIQAVKNIQIGSRINIISQEVYDQNKKQFWHQALKEGVNITHIALPLSENIQPNIFNKKLTLAKKIVSDLRHGNAVGKILKKYLQKQQFFTVNNLGWKKDEELPILFSQALNYKLCKIGTIIGPLRSSNGLHILKINNIRPANNKKKIMIEMKVRHILIPHSPIMSDQEAYLKLKKILLKIKSKKITFAQAEENLYNKENKLSHKKSDIRWIALSIYDPVIQDALKKLKKYQISEPIHTVAGWEIIKVLDIRYIDKTNVIQKNDAYHHLFADKLKQEEAIWLKTLPANSYIEIFDNDNE